MIEKLKKYILYIIAAELLVVIWLLLRIISGMKFGFGGA
jgi:hypothetical protein